MGEILQNWIQARLGVIMDLSPEVFGYYTRDGKMLAQILHSYDIISCDQVDTIISTDDPALCRVNLKLLSLWLRFLGVDCDDESVNEISCGKGTTSLRLFYKVYLSLESKDRLHFITLQKEREKFVPTSKKFDVTVVNEDPPPYQPSDHPVSRKLTKAEETVGWHRSKFPLIVRKFTRAKERQLDPQPQRIVQSTESCVPEEAEVKQRGRKKESQELDEFARKHRPKRTPERDPVTVGKEFEKVAEDPELAKAYVQWLKDRRKRLATETALKSNMQNALLSELWEKMADKQDRQLDEAIAKRVLDQSRYEKQIVTKLCEVRDQRNIMSENQRMVEKLMMEANRDVHQTNFEREQDLIATRQRDVETECQRMCEFRERLRQEKVEKLKAKHRSVCLDIILDIVNVALKIEDYRETNEGRVPLGLLSEWKALFLRNQPLSDNEVVPVLEIAFDEQSKQMVMEEVARTKQEKIELLRDALFEDYRDSNAPWNEFVPMLGEDQYETFELGRQVLGYLVHRLLSYIYPLPFAQSQTLLHKSKPIVVILGVSKSFAYEMIREPLDKIGVPLVRMEDAINFCLERYKSEMKNMEYVDLNILAATEEIVAALQNDKRTRVDLPGTKYAEETFSRRVRPTPEVTPSKLDRRAKKGDEEKIEDVGPVQEKQTQTPRNVPYDDMDPTLTDSAYIGKWAYEFLALGEPITNELATKILIEYLKHMADAKGWVLIDYPNTYDQMTRLEIALTGCRPPPDPRELEFEDISIEDVESRTPRIVFSEDVDPFALSRLSRLLPNPYLKLDSSFLTTFATVFVRVTPKPRTMEWEKRSYETINSETLSVDRFYAFRDVAYVFYYTDLDTATLRELVRFAMSESLRRKPSSELYAELSEALKVENEQYTPASKAPVFRRLLTETPRRDSRRQSSEVKDEEDYDYLDDLVELGMDLRVARPGEERWEWVDLPLPSPLSQNLGSLWESLEKVYIAWLKDALFLKSVHCSGIIAYKDLVTRNAKEFIERPDNRQDMVHEFHMAYNAIDEDARDDVEVKCELHRRVADFQTILWQVCDKRRVEAEGERRRYIHDEWTSFEATVVFNIYTTLLQAELDRFIDTMRVIQDYYMGMLNKPLQEQLVSKVILKRMEIDQDVPINFEQPSSETQMATGPARATDEKKKDETPNVSQPEPPPAVEYSALCKEISDLLMDRGNVFHGPEEISVFRVILENVRYATSIVDSVSLTANDILKNEDGATAKWKVSMEDSESQLLRKKGDLLMEWRYAIAYETDRVRLKLESITGAARTDIMFLLETTQGTFHQIYDSIVNRYWSEMRSVNEMANVFCLAIEEARPLENELLLDEDHFVVRTNVFVMTRKTKQPEKPRELESASRFQISQLSRLMEILKRVAPHGTLSERGLLFILQDLATHGLEEGESMSLPCSWYHLRSADIQTLIDQLFHSAKYIDWRELIVYALDLPMPSHREILIARDRFRIQDSDLNEIVTRTQYHHTPLWFLDCTDTDVDVYDLLRDGFSRNREELYEEEFHHLIYEGCDSLRGSRTSMHACELGNDDAMPRLILAKELLCRMYMVGMNSVNYTGLLLAFCKDEDPREGFGKALTLALGSRVCTDLEEGERYVEEYQRQKRIAREAHSFHFDAFEAASLCVNHLLRQIEKYIDHEEASMDDSSGDVGTSKTISSLTNASSNDTGPAKVSICSTLLEEEEEGESMFEYRDQELIIYWLPFDVCLTVLAAAIPWLVSRPKVLGTSRNLRECLTLVYEDLMRDDLCDNENVVLAHRLVNHNFMKKILDSTSKFTTKNIGSMVEALL